MLSLATKMDCNREKFCSLFHDPTYYTKSYEVYQKRSNFFPILEKWIDDEFQDIVVNKLVSASLDNNVGQLKMMGVGAGSGELDLKMALEMAPRFPKVHNTVLEPALSQVEKYRKLINQTTSEAVQGIEFDFKQQTIEEYRDSKIADNSMFHFISAVHSLYYVDDYDLVLGYLYDHLEYGGILRIDVNSDESGSNASFEAFPELQDDLRSDLTSQHIHDSLAKRGIPYRKFRQDIRVDLSPCLDDSQPARREKDLLLDFMAHTKDFRKSASVGYYRTFVDFIKSEKCSKRGLNGEVLFDDSADTFIIQKLTGDN